jgi:hypothetical protein
MSLKLQIFIPQPLGQDLPGKDLELWTFNKLPNDVVISQVWETLSQKHLFLWIFNRWAVIWDL